MVKINTWDTGINQHLHENLFDPEVSGARVVSVTVISMFNAGP